MKRLTSLVFVLALSISACAPIQAPSATVTASAQADPSSATSALPPLTLPCASVRWTMD